jgi:hypothetical protein
MANDIQETGILGFQMQELLMGTQQLSNASITAIDCDVSQQFVQRKQLRIATSATRVKSGNKVDQGS